MKKYLRDLFAPFLTFNFWLGALFMWVATREIHWK
jgi:hypothetical protein